MFVEIEVDGRSAMIIYVWSVYSMIEHGCGDLLAARWILRS